MFTGLVEGTGIVRALVTREGSARLTVGTNGFLDGARIGDSIAVNGVCVTVARINGSTFEVDLSGETLRRTTLGRLRPGGAVNLERPMALGDRLGGHLVQGHVDGVGIVACIRRDENARWLEITAPPELMRYVVEKGSVAVDGVSLTVATVSGNRFTVCLIPHTCAVTTLSTLRPVAQVNLEVDVLAKYVERLLAPYAPEQGPRSEAQATDPMPPDRPPGDCSPEDGDGR